MALSRRDAAAAITARMFRADGSAMLNHVALVRQARGAELPTVSGMILGIPGAVRRVSRPAMRKTGVAIWNRSCRGTKDDTRTTDNARRGAGQRIRLVAYNDVSYRNSVPAELAKGFGFYQSETSRRLFAVL